jgi:hypothetical protein
VKTVSQTYTFYAPAGVVFDHLDDLSVTGMHMTKSSMPMMGGKMNLQFLSANKKGLHTKYRWTGKALWMNLDFTVLVTEWVRGIRKTWETEGVSKMIIYSWFKMNLTIHQRQQQCAATLSVSYEQPLSVIGGLLCALFGKWYARWCISSMFRDTARKLAQNTDQRGTHIAEVEEQRIN